MKESVQIVRLQDRLMDIRSQLDGILPKALVHQPKVEGVDPVINSLSDLLTMLNSLVRDWKSIESASSVDERWRLYSLYLDIEALRDTISGLIDPLDERKRRTATGKAPGQLDKTIKKTVLVDSSVPPNSISHAPQC